MLLVVGHGCTFVGWGVVYPLALYICYFERVKLPNWLAIHRMLTLMAAFLVFSGIVIHLSTHSQYPAYQIINIVLFASLVMHAIAMMAVKSSPAVEILAVALMFASFVNMGIMLFEHPRTTQTMAIGYAMYLFSVATIAFWAHLHKELERSGHLQPYPIHPIEQKSSMLTLFQSKTIK